jgi:hypothetical protein
MTVIFAQGDPLLVRACKVVPPFQANPNPDNLCCSRRSFGEEMT